jgi:GNAT superfamily N-acetyltransferase
VTVVADRLAPRDVALLARMHVEALPESLVTLVGERYARAFYRHLGASVAELVLLERDAAGALVGACIVSTEPATLSRRLLVRTPLALMAPLALHRLPLGGLVRGALGGRDAAAPAQPDGPEILLVFTVPERRGSGVGARLLARAETLLAERGFRRLLVKTRDDPANRALGFYEREGFVRRASVTKLGKRLVLFEKPLTRGT